MFGGWAAGMRERKQALSQVMGLVSQAGATIKAAQALQEEEQKRVKRTETAAVAPMRGDDGVPEPEPEGEAEAEAAAAEAAAASAAPLFLNMMFQVTTLDVQAREALFPRPILPSFQVLARACLRFVERDSAMR